MAEYKNNIVLGIKLDTASGKSELESFIKSFSNEKINLKFEGADKAQQQITNLTKELEKIKSSMTTGMNLTSFEKGISNANKSINEMGKTLNKITQTDMRGKNVTFETKDIERSIGVYERLKSTIASANGEIGNNVQSRTVITNLKEQEKAIQDLENAYKKLGDIGKRDFVDNFKVTDLKSQVESMKGNLNLFQSSDLNKILADVKALETEEKTLMDIAKQMQSELDRSAQATAKANTQNYQALIKEQEQYEKLQSKQKSEATGFKNTEFIQASKSAYAELSSVINQQYAAEQKMVTATGSYKQALQEEINLLREKRTLSETNIKDNGLTNITKEKALLQEELQLKQKLSEVKMKNDESLKVKESNQAYKELSQCITDMSSKQRSLVGAEGEFKSVLQQEIAVLRERKALLETNIESKGLANEEKNLQIIQQEARAEQQLAEARAKASTKASNSGMVQEMSALSKVGNVLSDTGLFYGGMQVFQGLQSQLQGAVEWSRYLDQSFTDMRMTMDMSSSQFEQMSQGIDGMAKSMGVSGQELHDIARVYANATTDMDTIMERIKPEAMLQNISGIRGLELTKVVQSTGQAFEMLNADESNAGDVTQHIGDVFTAVSKNMKYDFASGIQELNNAVKVSGTVAKESGMSLEQYSAYMGALIERTGRSGTEMGTFWKMLTARVMQVKSIGEETGITAKEMGNAEKALTGIGVHVRDGAGGMRDMDSILQDVASHWGQLNDQQRQNVAEGVAGNRHRATFLSLMKSMTTEQMLYGKALNSTGELEKANDVKAQSLEGKLNTLKDTTQELYASMLNSNVLKGGVDVLTGMVGGVKSLTDNFGGLAVGVPVVTGAVALASSTFRTFLTGSILPFLATPLGATIGAVTVATYEGIKGWQDYNKVINDNSRAHTTDDLSAMGKVVNALTGHVVKSKQEMQDAGLIYKDFGEGVSSGFKQQVEQSRKEFQQFNFELTKLGQDGQKIDFKFEDSGSVKTSIDNIVNNAKSAIENKKEELKSSFTDLFNMDNNIDENESTILGTLDTAFDAKKGKVEEIQQNISDVWNKAISEHGQLAEEDKETIRGYVQDIQSIQAEMSVENNQDWYELQTSFKERIKGLSQDDAAKVFKDSSNEITNMYSKDIAAHKQGIDNLEKVKKEYERVLMDSNSSQEEKANAQEGLKALEVKIDEENNLMTKAVDNRRERMRELAESLYEMNPNLEGKLNLLNGDMLSDADQKTNAQLMKLESTYQAIDDVVKSGTTEITNTSTGQWNQMYVEVDEATGMIVGTFNRTTGEITGYTEQYRQKMEEMRNSYQQFQEMFRDRDKFNSGILSGQKLSIDDDGQFRINDDVITKLSEIQEKADGTRYAIASINGQEIEFDVDDNGAITNLDEVAQKLKMDIPDTKTIKIDADGHTEVIDKIQGEITNLPDDKSCNVEIGSTGVQNLDDLRAKIKDLPDDYPIDITVNGEHFDTVGELKEEIGTLPENTQITIQAMVDESGVGEFADTLMNIAEQGATINVDADTGEATTALEETIAQAEQLEGSSPTVSVEADTGSADSALEGTQSRAEAVDSESPNVSVSAETGQADSALDTTHSKADSLSSVVATPSVQLNTNGAEGKISSILNGLNSISGKVVSAAINVVQQGAASITGSGYAGGTDNATRGFHDTAENGFEILVHRKKRWFNGGEQVLNHEDSVEVLNQLMRGNYSGEDEESGSSFNVVPVNTETTESISIPVPTNIYGNYPVNNPGAPLQIDTSKTLDAPYKDDSWEEKDTTYMSKEEKKKYESEKKQWEIEKKERDKQEKILQDKISKEKQYLDDIRNDWDYTSKEVKNSIDEIELRETEYGDNIKVSQKIQVLTDKYQQQLKLLPLAEDTLATYKNATVETAEAQEELKKKIQDANASVIAQRKAIAQAYNEIIKYEREQLGNVRTQLAQAILAQEEEKLDTVKERTKKQEKEEKESLSREKKEILEEYDAKIKSKQAELKALEDETENNDKKLAALKKERSAWSRDDSAFGTKKQKELDKQIEELEKTIKKNEIQAEIDKLNEKKQKKSDQYDEDIDALNKYWEEKNEIEEKGNKKSQAEQKAYAKADKLLKEKNISEIVRLMQSKSEDFKDVGTLLGENFSQALTDRVRDSLSTLDGLFNKFNTAPNQSMNKPWVADVGDHVTASNNVDVYTQGSIADSTYKGTLQSLGFGNGQDLHAVAYDNGFLQLVDSNNNEVGWVDRYKLKRYAAQFATGGN